MYCAFRAQLPSILIRSSPPLTTLFGLKRLSVATRCKRFFCASNNMTSPLHPKFKSVENDKKVTNDPDFDNGFKFSIVSYNILAQVFVKSSYFPHSPSPCLKWKARSQAVLTVLKGFDSDFLCLQELDEYDSFYKEKLEASGYSSIYIQRSGQKRDGCGIFYKHNGPELVLEEKIEYNDLVPALLGEHNETTAFESLTKERGDPNDPRVRLKRDCVGIMGAFRLNDPSNHIVIVANTHIYWDPEWVDVKLAQAEYLLLRLSQFKDIVSNNFDCCPSIIVCGDFNSIPGDKVYQYIISGSSSSDDRPSLCSVYAYTGGEPAFTNCTPDFTNTLDYVFFSPSGHLKPVSILELPGPDSSDVAGGLPNFLHPSDHLPIGAEFKWLQSLGVNEFGYSGSLLGLEYSQAVKGIAELLEVVGLVRTVWLERNFSLGISWSEGGRIL